MTVALLRVSRGNQDLETQRLQIERWAASQEPRREVRYFEEDGVSGAALVRPGLAEIKKRMRAMEVSELVVVALDRLGRDLVGLVAFLDECRSLGVRVVSLREGLDYATPVGRLYVHMVAAFAEFEREIMRARTIAGLQAARKRGARIGNPGIAWDDRTRARMLELVAEATPKTVAKRGELTLWKRCRDIVDGKPSGWTTRPVQASEKAIRNELARMGRDSRGQPLEG